MCRSTDELAIEINRSRRTVQRIAAQLFGPAGWKRTLTDEQYQRLKRVATAQPGRHKSFLSPNLNNGENLGQTNE